MQYIRVNPSTAQTDTALISAPGTGQTVKVYSVYISSDTAMTVTIEEGSTALWRQYVAASGGQVAPSPNRAMPLFESPTAATALTYTTSANGNVFMSVGYEIGL